MSARAAAVLLLSCAAVLRADAPPAWVADAIRHGSTKEKLPAYMAPGLPVEYTTPFLRVARAANKAFREGKPLVPATVDPRAWTPELRVLAGARPAAPGEKPAAPRSARLLLGAGEAKATRMETKDGTLRAVFEVTGPPPTGATLEIRFAPARAGAPESVERIPLDFTKMRW